MSAFFIYICYNDFQLKKSGEFMSKIKIISTLLVNNDIDTKITKEVKGIKTNNKLIFKEDSINVVVKFDYSKLQIKREDVDYQIIMDFGLEESQCLYTLTNMGKMYLPLVTEELKVVNQEIRVKYKIYENTYEYVINYEVL